MSFKGKKFPVKINFDHMIEFKVCIPDDKTEQILRLFDELNLDYEQVKLISVSEDLAKLLDDRSEEPEYVLHHNDGIYQIFIHEKLRDDLPSKESVIFLELNKMISVLEKFPLNYPMAYKKFKVSESDELILYYFVREDLNRCYLVHLEEK